MLNAAIQNKGFPLAGLLANVSVQPAKYFADYLAEHSQIATNIDIFSPFAGGEILTNLKVYSAKFFAQLSAKISAENLTKPDIFSDRMMTNDDMGNLIKPNVHKCAISGGQSAQSESFANITHMHGNSLLLLLTVTLDRASTYLTRAGVEFLEFIKKGGIFATPLIHKQSTKKRLGYCSDLLRRNSLRATSTICRISSPALVPISSTRANASRAEKRCDSAVPSSWRRAISPCMAATMKPALLSPACFTDSIPSITSCGMRIDICFDLSLTVFVAMPSTSNKMCDSVYMKSNHTKHLRCDSFACNLNHTLSTGKAQAIPQIAKPGSGGTLTGPLTTTDKACIEVAVMNITTHPQGRNAHTLSSGAIAFQFIWLIAAVRRDCPAITAKIHHIVAENEQEARRTLARDHICFFAGRIRQEVMA